ncbi:MAG: sarcosine oxidase subunit delta [Proteobacteria bacterium]|nr:sarcosine oxidase subunit delta [Pseudomonadota bacterium]
MSFLIPCPQCGKRSVYEFRFGGEVLQRPEPSARDEQSARDGQSAAAEQWYRYNYVRRNESGPQTEWWFHRLGCQQWFQAERDTRTNQVIRTCFPDQAGRPDQLDPPDPPDLPDPKEPSPLAGP